MACATYSASRLGSLRCLLRSHDCVLLRPKPLLRGHPALAGSAGRVAAQRSQRSSWATSASAAQDVSGLPPRARSVLDFCECLLPVGGGALGASTHGAPPSWAAGLGEGWELAPPGDKRAGRAEIWFSGSPAVDREVTRRFGADCEALLQGDLDGWREAPLSALAAVIIGDQLARNAYRGVRAPAWRRPCPCMARGLPALEAPPPACLQTPKMYAADEKVLGMAKSILVRGGGVPGG